MNLDKNEISNIVAEKLIAEDRIYSDIAEIITHRVDKVLDEKLEASISKEIDRKISKTIDLVVTQGFEIEYQKVDAFGKPKGEKTSIRAELEKLVSGYWNCNVDRHGKPTNSNYDRITRAEYLMTKICAEDFSNLISQSARNITGALKDGFRNQIAQHMDEMLNGLFRVKSLQDQGKVEKPY